MRGKQTSFRRYLSTVLLLALVGIPSGVAVRAAVTSSDLQAQSINQLQAQQAQLQSLIKQKQAAANGQKALAKTAQDQIAKLNSEIADLQKTIAQTTSNIQQTAQTIDQLNQSISDKQDEISQKIDQVRLALRQYYKIEVSRQDMGYLGLIFSDEGLSQQERTKQSYASVKQQIQRRQAELETAKQQLADQKAAHESKKQALQDFQQQEALQKQQLAYQQNQQAALKQNADAAFAQLTAEAKQAMADEIKVESTITAKIQASITSRNGMSAMQRAANGTPVNQGDVIGQLGSTGFSTGPHVHFGVYTPQGATVNPMTRLGSYYIYPVSQYTITQGYGPANWSNSVYTFHNGVDFAGPVGQPVYAAADGKIIIDEYYGDYGCAVVIVHDDGWMTLYGHMLCKSK